MEPLISIIVLTYNSAEFILETLESIKVQTYRNIELVITDDSSTDKTVSVCKNWLENNPERFFRTKLIANEKNIGIPGNCNRGILAAHGEWIKLIAGDDYLSPDILSLQIEHINRSNKEIKFLWTNVGMFYDTPSGRQITIPQGISDLKINRPGITAEEQFEITLRSNPVFTAGMLVKKELYNRIGLYDENYKFLEDLPFLHKLLLQGIPLYYLDIIGAFYRKHEKSVQIKQAGQLRNQYYLDIYKYQLNTLPYYNNWLEKSLRWAEAKYNLFYTSRVSNRKNLLNKILLYIPTSILHKIIYLFFSWKI